MEKIKIQIDKTLTGLAGHSYGKHIFATQVLPYIEEGTITEVEFPEHIIALAISFVQGFMEHTGRTCFEDHFKIIGNPEFVEKFIEDVRF